MRCAKTSARHKHIIVFLGQKAAVRDLIILSDRNMLDGRSCAGGVMNVDIVITKSDRILKIPAAEQLLGSQNMHAL